jgi:hypothetical protein
VTLVDNDHTTQSFGEIALPGTGQHDTLVLGSSYTYPSSEVSGASGNDVFMITKHLTPVGNPAQPLSQIVTVNDRLGTNMVKFDFGVVITAIEVDQTNFGGTPPLILVSSVTLTLATGAKVKVNNPVDYRFQLGDGEAFSYRDFLFELTGDRDFATSRTLSPPREITGVTASGLYIDEDDDPLTTDDRFFSGHRPGLLPENRAGSDTTGSTSATYDDPYDLGLLVSTELTGTLALVTDRDDIDNEHFMINSDGHLLFTGTDSGDFEAGDSWTIEVGTSQETETEQYTIYLRDKVVDFGFPLPTASLPAAGVSTAGDDTITGTAADEIIQGGSGDDTIQTGRGSTTANRGNDILIGGYGDDEITMYSLGVAPRSLVPESSVIYRFKSDGDASVDGNWQATDGGDKIFGFRVGDYKLILVDTANTGTQIRSLAEFIADGDRPIVNIHAEPILTIIYRLEFIFDTAGTKDGTPTGDAAENKVTVRFDFNWGDTVSITGNESRVMATGKIDDSGLGELNTYRLTDYTFLDDIFGGPENLIVIPESQLPNDLTIL